MKSSLLHVGIEFADGTCRVAFRRGGLHILSNAQSPSTSDSQLPALFAAARADVPDGELRSIVVVPSYLPGEATDPIAEAARHAGFGPTRTLAAPTATAIAYPGILDATQSERVAVAHMTMGTVDLGVFDLTQRRISLATSRRC